jgi:hypothetical protein
MRYSRTGRAVRREERDKGGVVGAYVGNPVRRGANDRIAVVHHVQQERLVLGEALVCRVLLLNHQDERLVPLNVDAQDGPANLGGVRRLEGRRNTAFRVLARWAALGREPFVDAGAGPGGAHRRSCQSGKPPAPCWPPPTAMSFVPSFVGAVRLSGEYVFIASTAAGAAGATGPPTGPGNTQWPAAP